MEKTAKKRANFSGKIGYILATAGASVGLGNIWRFPYLAARYGGGIFILAYIVLGLTFGYAMIISETVIGRMSRKSPVGAFAHFHKGAFGRIGGWINAIVPAIIVPYYCVIGGWVLKYLIVFLTGNSLASAEDGFFTEFISNSAGAEVFFIVFAMITVLVVALGVNAGVERISKLMMPILFLLAVIIAIFSVTRPGAAAGVKYVLVPDFANFSIKTIVAAMEQMFYSLSIAMGILVTFGSYMKKDVDVERSTIQVAIVDSAIAILAALMIIPSVFAFSSGNVEETLNAGPSLLFISLPKVFANMAGGKFIGTLFFVMVLFAALTSAIALLESAVSTVEDELHLKRVPASMFMAVVMLLLGSLSSLGYNVLGNVTIFGMQFLDFFDFLANSLLMPVGALMTCILILRYVKINHVVEEVMKSSEFKGKHIYKFTVTYLAPILLVVIFVCSILTALGIMSV